MDKENVYMRLWGQVKEYLSLNIEYAKLTAADKVTMVLGLIAMGLVCVLLGTVFLFFLSLAVVQFIAPYVGLGWAYAIMAGFAGLLIAVVLLMRRQIIINPLARFITRVILK